MLFLVVITAFFIVLFGMPTLIKVARAKGLMDLPEDPRTMDRILTAKRVEDNESMCTRRIVHVCPNECTGASATLQWIHEHVDSAGSCVWI